MINQEPGSPNLSILSFQGGFHGRLFASLSCTRSKALHKVSVFVCVCVYVCMCVCVCVTERERDGDKMGMYCCEWF